MPHILPRSGQIMQLHAKGMREVYGQERRHCNKGSAAGQCEHEIATTGRKPPSTMATEPANIVSHRVQGVWNPGTGEDLTVSPDGLK